MNNIDSQPENKESMEMTDKTQNYIAAVVDIDTKINIVLSIVEKINFNLVQQMIKTTPAEMRDSQNFKLLLATLVYFKELEQIFGPGEAAPVEESKIIQP